jgi:hypothetical protein
MAFAKITSLIEAAVKDGQLATFDNFITFLGTKIDIDEDMQSYIDEFKKTLVVKKKASPKGKGKAKAAAEEEKTEKKKRAPSAYNLFIRDKMAELRTAGHKGNLMKLAVEEWKKSKAEASSSSTKVETEAETETKKVVKIKVVEKKEEEESDSDSEEAEDGSDDEVEYD